MKPIVITVDEHGKTSLTPEELQKIVDEAYQTGYSDGSRSVVITTPTYPNYVPQPHYLPTIVTCLSGE